jgi:hypothetical protein
MTSIRGLTMTNLQKVIRCWGIIDLVFVVYYLGRSVTKAQVPIYNEIKQAFQTTSSFGNYFRMIITLLGLALYVSVIFSGLLLFQLKKPGAIIVYIQTPLRLALLMPSLFFILWPLSYLFGKTSLAIGTGIILVLASESLKLMSVISWHGRLRFNESS